jgi:hypothetical protein
MKFGQQLTVTIPADEIVRRGGEEKGKELKNPKILTCGLDEDGNALVLIEHEEGDE